MENHRISATGSNGPRDFGPEDAPYAELAWRGARLAGRTLYRQTLCYDLTPGRPCPLDEAVTRLIAPNASVMTGPGTNTYLVRNGGECAVIDPGPADPGHIEAIITAAGGPIGWILCTHTHVDHAGGAVMLQNATGAKVATMPMAPGVSESDAGEHNVGLVLDRSLAEGDELTFGGLSVRALFTPGHASNHLCFLLPETGMLFTGDHIMQGSTVVIWPPDGNMRAYVQSLQRLLALELNILAPGHGYLIGAPHAEAQRLIQHRLARETKVRQALLQTDGHATLETLLPRVYDDVPTSLYPIAARSLEAHLGKLIEEGEVRHLEGRYWKLSGPG
jgi:glyoxylase-like metal-dependent hydrolase (beta-lactamase superfamily II)